MPLQYFHKGAILLVPDVDIRVFASTDDEILCSPAKSTPDNKFSLFLATETTHYFGCFEVDEVDLTLGHVDEDVF
jgi:hypothetical protein